MDRRSLLQSTGALVVGGLAGSRTGYAALASVAAGHLSHIGVHLYTLRSMLDDDFDGRVDFPAIFTKAEQAGLHYGIVEHDRPGDDPVASIAASYAYRDRLIELYGEEKGRAIVYAEAFEISEYGRRPSEEELRALFPTFDE